MSKLRIQLDGPTAMNGHVFYVNDDGTEVEISNVVQHISLEAGIEGPTTAVLKCIHVEGHMTAEVEAVFVDDLRPADEATSLVDRVRKYVPA